MAAQRNGHPVPTSAAPASSLLAPATPVTSQPGDASLADADYMIYDPSDPSLRRAQPDLPFFTEADAGAREGPLEHSLGFLVDLTQCIEALQIGFDGTGLPTDAMTVTLAREGERVSVRIDMAGKVVVDG